MAQVAFGRAEIARLQLNEDTIWAGGPYDPTHDEALPALPEVRKLIAGGRYAEAQKLAGEKLMVRPARQSYQPLGDLVISFASDDAVSEYRRELDLDRAVASTRYSVGSAKYEREVFISPVDQVIVMRLSASGERAGLHFTATFDSPQPSAVKHGGAMLRIESDAVEVVDNRPASCSSKTRDMVEDLMDEDPIGARILVLKTLGGFTNAEIAAMDKVRERTVERRWATAKSRFTALLHTLA